MWESIWEVVSESLLSLPILLVVYFLMELLEHKQQVKFEKFVAKSKKTGPLWGAVVGCIPQCAFSAVMADLFSRKMITIGTLFAVFIATSDEALVILISTPSKIGSVGLLIACKIVFAILIGFIIDLIYKNQQIKKDNIHHNLHVEHEHSHEHNKENCKNHENENHSINHKHCECKHDECQTCILEEKSCEECEHNKLHHAHELNSCCKKHTVLQVFLEALKHTMIIFAWILVVNLVLHLLMEYVGAEHLNSILLSGTIFEPILLTLLGLIPNCAASVAVVDLYINGIVSLGSCIGALCAGAGVGLIILFRNNKNFKQNLLIVASLYFIGVIIGFVLNLIPLFNI